MHHAEWLGGPVAAAQNAPLCPLVGYSERREMYCVELYAAVRLSVVDEGLSHHEAGRHGRAPRAFLRRR